MNIGKLIGTAHYYAAHPGESLEEHVEKCFSNFHRILEQKNLSGILENFICFFNITKQNLDVSPDVEDFIRSAVEGTIALHDIGKVNPLFQKKLGNDEFSTVTFSNRINSGHSIVSAIFYLDYYLSCLEELDTKVKLEKEQKRRLTYLVFLNSYIISRHHTNLTNFYQYVDGFRSYDEENGIIIEEIKRDILNETKLEYSFLESNLIIKKSKYVKRVKWNGTEDYICLYIYERLLYSLLLASDYYATSEQVNGTFIDSVGILKEKEKFIEEYENTGLYRSIMEYKQNYYHNGKNNIGNLSSLNALRSELFLDTQEELLQNLEQHIFFLEAPTGFGKSNTALNLSFQLLKSQESLQKIFYIYPFNTLIEQNEKIMQQIFGNNKELYSNIHVVNCLHSILGSNNENSENSLQYYQKVLLDRQFLNYPITLSTHVTLFDILFGERKESAFSFHQISNSIIVLDEIQSYKNSIWTEIITFFNVFAKILNLRVIIMSATLPDLSLLSLCQEKPVKLVNYHNKYYQHPIYLNRSRIHYDLLSEKCSYEILAERIAIELEKEKKVLVEFIRKKSAEEFYAYLLEESNRTDRIRLFTGDDNLIDRKRILKEMEDSSRGQAFLLIATQVIEAGVDLNNVDVGFKDISILDSDEQFMGRINRSCDGEHVGDVYFFSLDQATRIYRNDARTDSLLTLENEEMRKCLENKHFELYYSKVMEEIRIQNSSMDFHENVNVFFEETVLQLDMPAIAERMRLIDDDDWKISVFFNRQIEMENEVLLGNEIWNQYKELLKDCDMDYSKREVLLQDIRTRMSFFIYEVSPKAVFQYDEQNCEQVGELYYIEDGEEFFENGRFDRERFEGEGQMII